MLWKSVICAIKFSFINQLIQNKIPAYKRDKEITYMYIF